jgi:hypothetical protein
VLEGHLAEVVYESVIKKIHDVRFLIELITIAQEYNFTNKLQLKMVKYVSPAMRLNIEYALFLHITLDPYKPMSLGS